MATRSLLALSRRFAPAIPARSFSTTPARMFNPQQGNIPGANLPFNIHNKYKLTATFMLFFGSAFSLPFFVARFQLLKQ